MKHLKTPAQKRAFTLAELLTAVLVISIIMVALAPVITKRMKDNVSVTTDNKKGLEIFANPGTYTFDVPIGINTLFLQGAGGGGGGGGASYIDKTLSFTQNRTWTVPKGVSQITFTLTGSGGGGGGGYYTSKTDEFGGCGAHTNRIPYMADNGQDLCVTRYIDNNLTGLRSGVMFVKAGEQCSGTDCCYQNDSSVVAYFSKCAPNIAGSKGCGKTYCSRGAQSSICLSMSNYVTSPPFASIIWTDRKITEGRLITSTEYKRIMQDAKDRGVEGYAGPNGIDYCWGGYDPFGDSHPSFPLPRCDGMTDTCLGSGNNYCYNYGIYFYDGNGAHNQGFNNNSYGVGGVIGVYRLLCVRNLVTRELYPAAGGYSGASIEKTINVLPNDKLEITIGDGGDGGNANGGAGKQGETTQIIHKRGSTVLGTYYVKGGLGGAGAKSNAAGSNSGNATPAGTCYAKFKNKAEDKNYSTSQTCSVQSYAGSAGTSANEYNQWTAVAKGGAGAAYKNSGSGAAGATLDTGEENSSGTAVTGQGFDATTPGSGGGGGFCGRGKTSCQKGGKGGKGKVEISYRVMLPGGGGGAGTRVGGTTDAGVSYEIKYKVQEGSRIVFEVGSGGSGGSQGQDGANGTPTVIGSNDLIFLAGHGGYSITQSQKNSLSNCIGTNEDSTVIGNCIDNANYKAKGGEASRMTVDYEEYTGSNALGLIVNTANVSHSIVNTKYKGYDGKKGSQNRSVVPFTYGFDGGVGGAPFGIRPNNIIGAITCGGGLSGNNGLQTDPEQYICTSGSPNANNAKPHDSANNEFGGSGGGGGGVIDTSFDLGSGGSGSNGYLRIRWDASEQE